MPRSPLIPFVASLAAGLGLGLFLGWIVFPVQYIDTDPASLHQAYKDDYILMIAAVHAQERDLSAARAALAQLGFAEPGPAVAAAAERMIAGGQPEDDVRRMVELASALGAVTPALQPYLP